MPTNYNFTQDGLIYSFDDIFIPSDLFREGTLWTWGTGTSGQLGNATSGNRSIPSTTFAGGTNWKQVSCGYDHTAAIKTDGTLWIWGRKSYGKLGNTESSFLGTSTPVTTFAGGNDWKQVSCGDSHTAAIKTDGTLWIWGYARQGALGNTVSSLSGISTPITTFAGGTNWKQVSCGDDYTSAIKTDGTLWTWGYRNALGVSGSRSTPVTTISGGTDWKQVSAGDSHTAAIKTDGTLWIWGSGSNGRLGGNNTTTIYSPVTTFAGGTNWKQVSAGDSHTAAIKTDGTLWIWGSASDGKLGTNDITPDRSIPVTTFAGGNNWKQVVCDRVNTAAIKTDGTLWNWGDGYSGRLGNGVTTDVSTPVTTFAGGTNWKQVEVGGFHSAAVTYEDPVI